MATRSVPRRLCALGITTALGVAALASVPSLHAAATTVAPPTFTPETRADAATGTTAGENEPQVTVDRTGLAYVSWQTGLGADSPVTTTRDGVSFSALTYPDKGNSDDGDVAFAHASYPSTGQVLPPGPSGANGVFFAQLGPGSCNLATSNPPDIEIRAATTTDQGATWSPRDASCEPCQVDRPWVAAYTPAADRDTADATKKTQLYMEYHDFCASNVWGTSSTDGGATWNTMHVNAEQVGSPEQITSACNSIPGGIAVAQGGAHAGRVVAVWSTSDPFINGTTGCNYSQFQPFDHIFASYSDDGGQTWTSTTVFNDPCEPNPPSPPPSAVSSPPVGDCQDVSELFDAVASDDAGNLYVAYTARLLSDGAQAEYDTFVAGSTDGGVTWTSHRVTPKGSGTHYAPWIAAGGNGGIDVVYYATPFVDGVGSLNKPAAVPPTAQWDVDMAQSLDGGTSWTNTRVSTHPVYFGDYCTTGISCGTPLSTANNWGPDRILYDDFGVAVGPDGGARIAWTDAHDSWSGACVPGANSTTSCQTTHVYFACQNSGTGVHGETITGCGQVAAAATGATPTPAPATPAITTPNTAAAAPSGGVASALAGTALAAAALAMASRRRRRARR